MAAAPPQLSNFDCRFSIDFVRRVAPPSVNLKSAICNLKCLSHFVRAIAELRYGIGLS
jgi:hypothetical protein